MGRPIRGRPIHDGIGRCHPNRDWAGGIIQAVQSMGWGAHWDGMLIKTIQSKARFGCPIRDLDRMIFKSIQSHQVWEVFCAIFLMFLLFENSGVFNIFKEYLKKFNFKVWVKIT